MSENPSPFETAFRSLPAEYRAWYNSRLSFFGQNDLEESDISSTINPTNVWPSETITQPESTDDFALPTMPPFGSLASSNSSRHFFTQEPVYDGGSVEASGDHCENVENTASNLNSWNYLYYLQLLNEVERGRRSSQVSAVSVESQETDNVNEINFSSERPTESYSEKLKKGLGNETSFPFEKSSFGFPSQVFLSSENKDAKQEFPKQRHSATSRSFNKKNAKKKSTKEDDFAKDEEIKLENVGANNTSTQSEGNYCEACNKSSPNAALNNTLPGNSCPSGIKCPLNVNNLHKKAKREFEQEEKTKKEKGDFSKDETLWKERDKKANQNVKNKKTKGKNLLNGLRKDSVDENDCELEMKAKRKGFPLKGARQRTDRGKLPRHSGSRKRHANDAEKEFFLDHFVSLYSFLCSAVNQASTQPWFKYTVDGVVSLLGVVFGSLCVFGVIAWEGLKAFKTLCSSYAGKGYEWLKLNSLSIVHTIFLKTPGLSGYASKAAMKLNENSKFEKLPSNGNEAVERLLKLKGQDPYLILGVTTDCTDEDIKKRYKTQAVLVHPDKNHFTGAEEAFKILASAFEILGNTDKRAEFDKENNIRREGNEEMASFLERIQKNIEEIQSILGCRSCGKSHKRYKTEKQADSARYCASCKTHHAARLGDLWAETSMFGFKWHYYAYLENEIYDVTEWVTCQTDLMSTVEANTHTVPCRLATPKNKNRTSAHSRMEDLKDLVNDLLNKSRQGNQENAFTATSGAGGPDKSSEGKSGKAARKQGGTNGGRRRK